MKTTIRPLAALLILGVICAFASCRKSEAPPPAPAPATVAQAAPAGPDRVVVQHILIAFQGTIPDAKVTRTREEAEKLAGETLARAKAGEDFDALVKALTDDQHPGIYRMANAGVEPDSAKEEYSRTRMVKGFGDVGFSLAVGEVGLASFDPASSKYGWHIIKRLE
jgi:parvulin-like peptidyl-prolyl isomerase